MRTEVTQTQLKFSKKFTAPDPQGSIGAVFERSFLDRHFDILVPVLLGDSALPPKLERALPRYFSNNVKHLLNEGLEKSRLGHKNLLRALRDIGLHAEVPFQPEDSDHLKNIWAKRYARGYLKALNRGLTT